MAKTEYIIQLLRDFAEEGNVKEIRNVIKKYSEELEDIDTRDLNNTVPLKGYRFVKRDKKTTFILDKKKD